MSNNNKMGRFERYCEDNVSVGFGVSFLGLIFLGLAFVGGLKFIIYLLGLVCQMSHG